MRPAGTGCRTQTGHLLYPKPLNCCLLSQQQGDAGSRPLSGVTWPWPWVGQNLEAGDPEWQGCSAAPQLSTPPRKRALPWDPAQPGAFQASRSGAVHPRHFCFLLDDGEQAWGRPGLPSPQHPPVWAPPRAPRSLSPHPAVTAWVGPPWPLTRLRASHIPDGPLPSLLCAPDAASASAGFGAARQMEGPITPAPPRGDRSHVFRAHNKWIGREKLHREHRVLRTPVSRL